MPTGYTANITEDTTLAEFAMACARAFGALVSMREDPADAEIPTRFEPSDHHATALRREESRLDELRSMSPEQATALCAAAHASALASWRKGRAENTATRARYERLLGLVRAWKPPTKDHEELRDFMIQQLTSSVECDCYIRDERPVAQPPEAWLAAQIEAAEWSIAYHAKEGAAEIERARSRTEWVRALRDSLRAQPTT